MKLAVPELGAFWSPERLAQLSHPPPTPGILGHLLSHRGHSQPPDTCPCHSHYSLGTPPPSDAGAELTLRSAGKCHPDLSSPRGHAMGCPRTLPRMGT